MMCVAFEYGAERIFLNKYSLSFLQILTGSKWRMTIDEFEYSYFPPYIAGLLTSF